MEEVKKISVVGKDGRERRYKSTLFYRGLVKFVKFITRFFWPTKVFFKERYNIEGRAIITSNHYCKMDSCPIINTFFRKKPFVIMMKAELMEKDGFVAKLLDEIGAIPVKRQEADLLAIKSSLRALKNDYPLVIFPEGTRNRKGTKEMLPLRDGTAMFAIKTHSPIVPILHYRCAKWYRRNYLIVGHPFTLEEFYDDKTPDARVKATKIIEEKYAELRKEVDEIVEVYKGNLKKYKKAHNMV